MIQGFEWDAEIVETANANGLPVKEADVTKLEPKKLNQTYALHASPVCTNVSVANSNASENDIDILSAEKVAEFITAWDETKAFSMENVMPYRNTKSFATICNALEKAKYKYRFFNMPFANYGVPQTRERLILLAHKDYMPSIPTPTHSKEPDNLFKDKWIGWYEAIEDLIDTLPESKFADWQLKRLEELDWFGTGLFPSGNVNANTFSDRKRDEPSQTQIAGGSNKAFLLSGENASSARPLDTNEPMVTLRARNSSHHAFIFRSDNTSSQRPYGKEEPAPTTTATEVLKSNTKAWLDQGRVVKMTPRANARFQSFHDSYILPDNKTLAQKIIGNAVPPLGAYHFAKELQ